ncbi:hypothetical protein FYC51_13355 [Agromyces mariniharenae]|uniref:Uncharacterized protein n=1 Tax=Agromyces mariniharenae TaxID=2604423 RepID=A0A5S4UX87_9MICO|nr:hypothetical protein FYC51_13355 [Agromyces mariniharenae]
MSNIVYLRSWHVVRGEGDLALPGGRRRRLHRVPLAGAAAGRRRRSRRRRRLRAGHALDHRRRDRRHDRAAHPRRDRVPEREHQGRRP